MKKAIPATGKVKNQQKLTKINKNIHNFTKIIKKNTEKIKNQSK
jgi:hypothetical protein